MGQYEDEETGLFYNRFRYYDAEKGSYISKDPIALEGGLKQYNYVDDVNFEVDLFGEASFPWHHMIPQEMFKNPEFMRQLDAITGRKARDYVNRQGVIINEVLHKDIHKGAGGGAWNETFKDWFEDELEAGNKLTRKGIQNQLKKMMKDFNIPRSSRTFARKYKRKTKTRFKPKYK